MLLSLFDQIPFTKKITLAEEAPAFEQDFEIFVREQSVPVRIRFEPRFNNRVTVNKNGILIRVSDRQRKEEQRKNIDTLLKWAKEKLGDKPEFLESLPQRDYRNGELLKVGEYEFMVSIIYQNMPKSTARIFKNNIVISLTKGLNIEAEASTSSYLIAKCLCKFFQPITVRRIAELNNRYFKKDVKNVKLKYATSFWGHCSHQGDIVVSLRLMFAPAKVIDYVLIHELAHLVEHNHSQRFWKVVEQVMPDYREAEKFLKENHLKYYL